MFALMFAATLSFTACGGSDDPDSPDVPEQPDTPTTPDEPSKGEALSPTEQKQRLDNIAREFMQNIPSTDFKSYADLGNHLNDTYSDYDWDNVGDWARKCWDDARTAVGGKPTVEQDSYGYCVYTEYKSLLLASNFVGHFKADNGSRTWVKESGKFDDLQFTFTDQNGKTCVLKLETGGKVQKVYLANVEDWTDYESKNENGIWKYYDYYDRTQCTIGVPENIAVTLTQNGTQLVKATVKVGLGSLTGENFDISKGNLTASALVEMSNGYKFDVAQVAYSGNSKAFLSYSMSKNGTKLASVTVAGDVSGIPSCNVEAFTRDDFDADFDSATGKNVLVKIDILGKLQLQGKVTDLRKYAELLDKADENDDNEQKFKQYLSSANGCADISLFYDNTSVEQAKMQFDAFSDTYGGYTYWDAEPVLVFKDGSSNCMFDVFFNDVDFKATIDAFRDLVEKYENLIK